MNRKLLFGLLMLLFSSMSISMFTSCKDDAEDKYDDLKIQNASLAQKIEALQQALNKVDSAQQACKQACEADSAMLQAQLNQLDSLYKALKNATDSDSVRIQGQIQNLLDSVADHERRIAALEAYSGMLDSLKNKYIPFIDGLMNNMNAAGVTSFEDYIEEIVKDELSDRLGDLNNMTVEEYVSYYINSMFQQFSSQFEYIYGELDSITQNYGALKDELDSAKTAYDAEIAALKQEIENLKNSGAPDLTDRVAALETQVGNLESAVTTLQGQIAALQGLQSTVESLNTWKGQIETWKSGIDAILNGITNEDLKAAIAAVEQATWVETNKEALQWLIDHKDEFLQHCACTPFDPSELEERLDSLENEYDSLLTQVSTIQSDLTQAKLDITENANDIAKILRFFGLAPEDLNAEDVALYDYKALVAQVEQNKLAIEQLKTDVEALKGTINNIVDELITSILVQQVYNHVLGSVATPFGIQSNILMTYYGWNNNNTAVSFPTNFTDVEYMAPESEDEIFSQKVLDELHPAVYDLPDGYLVNGEGNMGKIYLTINPSNVDFTKQNVDLTMVNSQGQVCPVTVGDLRLSDEVLSFGYGRAQNTYFYEVPVTIDGEGITALHLERPDVTKEQVKDLLKNRGIGDLASIAKTLYNQYNKSLQAYALQTVNTVDADGINKERTVTSQYNFAATCVKPLSFRFLAGKEFTRDVLPTISPLSEYIDKFLDKINLEIRNKDFSLGDFTFNFGEAKEIYIDPNGIDIHVVVTVEIPIYDDQGNQIGHTYGDVDINITGKDMASFVDQLNDALKDAFGNVDELIANIQDQLEDFIDDVSKKIDEYLDSFVQDINEQIQGIKDDIKADLKGGFGRLDNFINRYNNFAARVNNIFHNPNHYLQVVAVYKNNSGTVSQLSNSLGAPSKFRKASGNAIELFLTTYSLELAAPSFKKYVAITGKFDANHKAVDCNLAALNTGDLNKVLDGRQIRFALPTNQLEAGYTYEVTYQALDYHGVTSTRKMYFQIVK